MKQLEFDYDVVGGGAAGCVVAARMASETTATVALIERGRSDVNRWIHIPATFFKTLQSQIPMPLYQSQTLPLTV